MKFNKGDIVRHEDETWVAVFIGSAKYFNGSFDCEVSETDDGTPAWGVNSSNLTLVCKRENREDLKP